MALGDIGSFLPTESHYGTPGAYDKMLQAEASKRAAYLSSMDQFYENLEEAQRQFDETLEFKTETRDLELAWAREKQTKELAFERERLAAQERYQEGMLDIYRRENEGKYGDSLTPFQQFKAFNLLEKEGRQRGETRESAVDLLSSGRNIEPGSFWEGPGAGYRNVGPSSGEVRSLPGYYYGAFGNRSAAELPAGRRQSDYPNWIPPEYDESTILS